MNTGQMLLVMLAIVLFSSIVVSTQNNLFTLANIAYRTMFSMQGYKIADRFLQEIDAYHVSAGKTFAQIQNDYTFVDSIIRVNAVDYHIDASTQWSDQYGGAAIDALKKYQRIDIRIYYLLGVDTVRVGTDQSPISYIYGRME